MNATIRKGLSILFILASVAIVVIIAFSNEELGNAWDAVASLDYPWLAGILLCWACYAFFEAFGIWLYLRAQGYSLTIGRTLVATLIGFYYSNITPSAAGGQPMQVNSLRKAGIPVGYGTMAATIRFICNQTMVALIALVLYLGNREFVTQQLGSAVWLVWIGWAVNFSAVPVVLMAAFHRTWVQKLAGWLIHLLAKIRLIRHPDETMAKVTNILDTYHTALKDLLHAPGQILTQMGASALCLLGLMGSVIFVYHAFGLSGASWMHLLTLSFLLFVSASYTPLPGASGAQEGGFLLYFRGIFTDGVIGLALLVWRFFTYYLFLIVGVFILVLERVVVRREQARKQASAPPEQPEEP